jgi:hypothetical protein
LATARFTKPSTRSKCGLAHQRTDVGGLVAGVALDTCAAREEPLPGTRRRSRPGRASARRQADLPGVVELLDREVDREVEIGVVEHEQRRLAAELERHRRDVAGGAAAILPDVGTDPVKQIAAHVGVSASGAPASVPRPCTTLNTPSGRPGIVR